MPWSLHSIGGEKNKSNKLKANKLYIYIYMYVYTYLKIIKPGKKGFQWQLRW